MLKMALAILLLQAPSPPPGAGGLENQKYEQIDALFVKSLNHSRDVSADQEAERTARQLVELYPNDPYVYNLWASTEWLLIGRELNLKADEQKNVEQDSKYRPRAERYQVLTEKGLALTDGKNDERSLFLRAALKFDQAKFASRYEGRVSGLSQADQKAVDGIRILKQLLTANPNFCSAYLFLGGTRLQFSVKSIEGWANWAGIRLLSYAYSELRSFDSDVFSETRSVKWLEKSYQCGYGQPWLKKSWLETGFLLTRAYRDYGKNLDPRDRIVVLKKGISILKQLGDMFPQNQDVLYMLFEEGIWLKSLEDYFHKK